MNWLLPWRWPLRRKLVAIILLILIFPLAALNLLRDVEKVLISANEEKLLAVAEVSAAQLNDHPQWFNDPTTSLTSNTIGVPFHVFPLTVKPVLDGYFNEWQPHWDNRKLFPFEQNEFGVLLGQNDHRLYLSMTLKDDYWVYASDTTSNNGDSIQIDLYTLAKNQSPLSLTSFVILPLAPGPTPVFRLLANNQKKLSFDYRSFLSEIQGGINIEMRLPVDVHPVGMAISWNDLDDAKLNTKNILSTASFDMNPVVWPKPELIRFVDSLQLKAGRRLTVLDNQGRVLARAGELRSEKAVSQLNWLVQWLLASEPPTASQDNVLKLDSPLVFEALKGTGKSQYISSSSEPKIMASWPITARSRSDGVQAILLLEESTSGVQITQQKVLSDGLLYFSIVFILLLLIILWYANRLTRRLRRLTQAVENAVDTEGRIQTIPQFDNTVDEKGDDEIDALYSGFLGMSEKLVDYNEYLENLASRLSHELRTPIAIVRSSLDNLTLFDNLTSKQQDALQRAIEGNHRLSEIISRMRQASSVKNAMQSADKKAYNLAELVKNLCEGYRQTYPQKEFQWQTNNDKVYALIAPDLFVEMLDKILGNALDFAEDGSAIEISLFKNEEDCCLSIFNRGPFIPKKNLKRIFSSMVSIRNSNPAGTNLGLGLHVAKLIADFHQAKIKARNVQSADADSTGGVVFEIRIPLTSPPNC